MYIYIYIYIYTYVVYMFIFTGWFRDVETGKQKLQTGIWMYA